MNTVYSGNAGEDNGDNGKIWHLSLYVVGNTHNMTQTQKNLETFCEKYLFQKYELEVIDIRDHPELAEKEQIIAIPTLVKKAPSPQRKIIGDLSNFEGLRINLDLPHGIFNE